MRNYLKQNPTLDKLVGYLNVGIEPRVRKTLGGKKVLNFRLKKGEIKEIDLENYPSITKKNEYDYMFIEDSHLFI